MPPTALIDVRQLDLNKVLVDLEGIRKVNPQRFEMEQLTAIVYVDPEQHLIVGYKDVTEQEFWCRGHMPGYPIMPGVIICEAAAQLCAYYCRVNGILGDGDFIAFGGMENVRFRGPVRPGDRLVLAAKAVKIHRRQVLSAVQGYVGQTMVFQGEIIGLPFHRG
ncbi:MAG: beta-hydroxyacyl-ACP dehydratase [Gemmatales bacterium]|nr:beta-hydroxyacyl-ACP dehydratase [Gemmatales bacterium]MDW8385778.1 3-hydroxyacyl-ACP dehydratase FabZ family protein [Gemmatales bacterium]